MNTLWIVMPILLLLMFELGLTLSPSDFLLFRRRPRPILVGMVGQLLLLPAVAFALCLVFEPSPLYFAGIMLIALSPGGSSSNVFSLLAGGDVALSVSLTAVSSVLTLFTMPLFMEWVTLYLSSGAEATAIHLPVGSLLMQNLVLMLVPIVLGVVLRLRRPAVAQKVERVLSKVAFPLLIVLATVFFINNSDTIIASFSSLAPLLLLLLLLSMGGGALLSSLFCPGARIRRTLVIEIGMQNAAQAIAVASSPLIFNSEVMAVPAIVYALLMNVVLLIYVAVVKPSAKKLQKA